MKKILPFAALNLAISLAQGVGVFTADWNGDISIEDDSKDKVAFRCVGWGQNWEYYSTFTLTDKEVVRTDDSYAVTGKLRLKDGKECALLQSVSLAGKSGSVEKYALSFALEGNEFSGLRGVTTDFVGNMGMMREGKVLVDGVPFSFPEKTNPDKFSATLDAKKIELVFDDGVLTINCIGRPFIQDDRKFGNDTFSIRFDVPKRGGGYEADLEMEFKRPSFDFVPLGGLFNATLDTQYAMPSHERVGFVKYDLASPNSAVKIGAGESLEIPANGKAAPFAYILSAGESLANIDLRTKSGGQTSGVSKLKSSAKVWTSELKDGKTLAVYSNKIGLDGQNCDSLIIENRTDAPVYILAATLSDTGCPAEKLFCHIITAGSDYFPIEYIPEVVKGSALDFSFLMDAPAGKYGFATPQGDDVEFEKRPGKPAKFFGNNTSMYGSFPPKELAGKVADSWARTGYNLCRIHYAYDELLADMDSPDGTGLKKDMLDKLDFFIAKLKERGIYITTDLYISRHFKEGVIEPEFKYDTYRLDDKKALFFLSKNARENLKKFSANLLNHVNPYTGLALKDDPALISINLVNENTIVQLARYSNLAPVFQKKYREWLKEKNLPYVADNDGLQFEKFLTEVEEEFYQDMKTFLRSMGVKAMLTDQNHMSSAAQSLQSRQYDILDTHTYYGHPVFYKKDWQLPAALINTSSIPKFGAREIGRGAQAIKGKPFSMTEWNHVINNDTSAEGAFLMGAYGALHGWDILCRYAYRHPEHDFKPIKMDFFDTGSNPVISLSERAAALFLLRGDVRQSDMEIPYLVSADFLENASPEKMRQKHDIGELYLRLALVGSPKIIFADKISDIKLPPKSPFALISEKGWEKAKLGVPTLEAWNMDDLKKAQDILGKDMIDAEKGVYTSSTKEMQMDAPKGVWKLVTPRSEAFIAPKETPVVGKFAKIETGRNWAAVLASSLDSSPLEKSSRILVLHLSDIKNTNMLFGDPQKENLLDWGGLPLLLRRTVTAMTLNLNPDEWTCYALSANGERLGKVEIQKSGRRAKLSLDTRSVYGPALAYELVKK